MTKVNSPPPLRLLSVASKGVPLVINFGLETAFFLSDLKRDQLIFKSTRLLYLTPIHGQHGVVSGSSSEILWTGRFYNRLHS